MTLTGTDSEKMLNLLRSKDLFLLNKNIKLQIYRQPQGQRGYELATMQSLPQLSKKTEQSQNIVKNHS